MAMFEGRMFFVLYIFKRLRIRIILKAILVLVLLVTIFQLLLEPVVEEKPIQHLSLNIANPMIYDRDQICQFPILDPFDPSILQYVKHPYPIYCQRVQPEFTYMDGNHMNIDTSLAQRHRLNHVYYRNIIRKNESQIKYGNWTAWNFTRATSIYLLQSVEVYGLYLFDPRDSKMPPKRYRNLHATAHVNVTQFESRQNETEQFKMFSGQNGTQPMNVLIFGIDSLSRSNFIRNLPKTYAILTELMQSIVFRGYTKVDDNTFPNILAVLTGRKVTIHGSELSGDFQNDFVDHYPFMWKNFSSNGYVTGLAEEQPGVLSYKAKGFENPPVDWYLRPFGMALAKSPLRKYSSPYCVGNRPESKIILQSISQFIKNCHRNNTPYFLFTFLWKLSHDITYDVEMIDHIIADFFIKLYEEGYFNNTLIFVMSDHGNRFDHIRQTLIGRIEERMPYLSIFIPPSFRAQFPSLVENLKTNVWRLTCQFDVYETMVDIITRRYGDENLQRIQNRGRSLFTIIPKSRTCQHANISAHFCVCQKEEDLDRKLDLVRLAANYALERINFHFLASNELRRLCSRVKLKSIISAQKYKSSNHVKYAVRWHYSKLLTEQNVTSVISNLRVTFSTYPGDGIFEALVQYYEPDKKVKNQNKLNASNVEISRINPYGDNGNCVTKINRNLEKFCFCKRGFWLFN